MWKKLIRWLKGECKYCRGTGIVYSDKLDDGTTWTVSCFCGGKGR